MVYICYIIYSDYVMMCVLAVGDDELAVGDDDASSVVAGGGACAGVPRELTWVCKQVTRQAGSGLLAIPGTAGTKM
jgi:hypothetical protein